VVLIRRTRKLLRSGAAWLDRARRRRSEPHGIVLMYHRVAETRIDPWGLCVAPDRFNAQIQVLARRADIVPLAQIRDVLRVRNAGRPAVAVTFDDGYADNLERAAPALRRCAAPATVFLATGFIGAGASVSKTRRSRPYWWDDLSNTVLAMNDRPSVNLRLQSGEQEFVWEPGTARSAGWRDALHRQLWEWLGSQPDAVRSQLLIELRDWAGSVVRAGDAGDDSRPMSENEVRELVADGLITIGAHTHSHSRLSRLDSDAKLDDVRRSRDACERLTGSPPRCFAYPNGDLDDESVRIVGSLGFEVACTSHQDLVWRSTDPLRTPRISVADWSADEFERRIFGYWLN
jgi:peptidoglycan/xylan/chitin deacetylase (PgdA/CDA1 family)